MQVKITGKNLDIGAALRAHIENRIFDIAEKYFNGTVSAHVTLEKQRAQFTADCTLHLATGLVLQAHGHDTEALPSYDKAASHLEKQLRRYKRRLKDHNDSRVEPVRRRAAADYVIASGGNQDAEEPKDLNPVIIAESSAEVPELSVGEAVMQLDISTGPFLLFRNVRDGGLNVVYRRPDGNIGWIDPHLGAAPCVSRATRTNENIMNLAEIIDSRSILPSLRAQNKKQLLQELAHAAGKLTATDHRVIFETLLQREKLASTGIGHGIAIPHGKIPTLTRIYGLFARLSAPVEFEAVDNEPVDLVFLLLAPEHAGADHLKWLARISRLLRDHDVVAKLRGTETAEGLYAILTEPAATPHAA